MNSEMGKEVMEQMGGFAWILIGDEQVIISREDAALIRTAISQLD